MTARALARVGIELFKAHRRYSGEVEKFKRPHSKDRAPYAVVLPAPRGSDDPAAQTGDPALPFERPAKSNILHQRNVWVAAQALKNITPDKQRLITRADFGHA